MRSLLWLFALILIVGWGFGFFVWAAPAFVHMLLVLGIILVIYNILSPPTSTQV